MDATETNTLFNPLWDDVAASESFATQRPLLAHYTSISTLERIMASDEFWFSNPLYMNDLEELRFGMKEGLHAFINHDGIRNACKGNLRYGLLAQNFEGYFNEFELKHELDTYVLCFSRHEPGNDDGVLSMWRGYGGNGTGAAIVIDTAQLNVNESSPFIISKVIYATREQRLKWVGDKLNQFADLLFQYNIPDEWLYVAANALFERLKIAALFTKHNGFHEENEWRVAYLSQRDVENKLFPMLHYSIGASGIEPKLKFKVAHLEGITAPDLSLEKIVDRIILGPSISSPLALKSVKRMLEKVGKHNLITRVAASSTPFRSS